MAQQKNTALKEKLVKQKNNKYIYLISCWFSIAKVKLFKIEIC